MHLYNAVELSGVLFEFVGVALELAVKIDQLIQNRGKGVIENAVELIL